jgi:hypothetical protein
VYGGKQGLEDTGPMRPILERVMWNYSTLGWGAFGCPEEIDGM